MSNERPISLIGAMDSEVEELLSHSNVEKEIPWNEFTFTKAELLNKSVVIVKCGVGKVFAAMVCERLIDEFNPSAVIFTGVGGALNSKLEIGDVVLSKDCVQHDIDAQALGFSRGEIPYSEHRFFKADKTLISLALKTKIINTNILEGRILTGDQFITRKEMKDHKYLIEELKGDAIEMEGGAIAQVCELNKIPFLIVRTMSDKVNGDSVKDFTKFANKVAKNSYLVVSQILDTIGK
ncbi:MAG: 5'-methylthioadenosine/adenosylhomocysteine nucleosidase [Thermodesulfobacteriota bacterium]